MIVETEAARHLVHRAAFLKDKGENYTREASIAKYFAAEAAQRAATKAVKVHGGYGYSNEYPVERYYRDVMAMILYEGTAEIQKPDAFLVSDSIILISGHGLEQNHIHSVMYISVGAGQFSNCDHLCSPATGQSIREAGLMQTSL